jgi:hypothetical protein
MIPIDEIQMDALLNEPKADNALLQYSLGIFLGSISGFLLFASIDKRMDVWKKSITKNNNPNS